MLCRDAILSRPYTNPHVIQAFVRHSLYPARAVTGTSMTIQSVGISYFLRRIPGKP